MEPLELKPFDAILFDLGNVIFNLDIPGAISELSALLKPGIEEDQVFEVIKKFEVGKISTDLFINGILRLCPYTVQATDVILAWNSMLVDLPAPRIIQLQELKKYYQIYLLSNNNALHYKYLEKYLLDIHGLSNFNERCFHATFYSHQIGLRKPDQDAFDHVTRTANLIPQQTLFVDDMPTNIVAAKKIGFQTILFHPGSDFLKLAGSIIKLRK
jgi:putative hydrolase of the HAD superfamily